MGATADPQPLVLPEYDANWPVDLQQRWLAVARRIDVRGSSTTQLEGADQEVEQLEREIRAAGRTVRRRPTLSHHANPPPRLPSPAKDTPMTTVTSEPHADLPPPPRALGRTFGESIRNLSDALRAERDRILRDRAETDGRLREIAAELAALDAAERVYRRKVDGAVVSRPKALPAPAPPRRTQPLAVERSAAGGGELREQQLHEWADTHGGEIVMADLCASLRVHTSSFNRAIPRLLRDGVLVKADAGAYRRA